MPLILGFLILFCAFAAPSQADEAVYQANSLYCQYDQDCAVKEGVCGQIVMNKYFDNSTMLAKRRIAKCRPTKSPRLPLKCLQNTCVSVSDGFECKEESKICPDGSFVNREKPNCQFAKCPGEEE